MNYIIISYRDDATKAIAQSLYDQLCDWFPKEKIILGVQSLIKPGDDFVEVIQDGVKTADVLVLLINANWIDGNWLLDKNSYDQIAIVAALEYKTRLIPVLIDGAAVPSISDLGEEFASIARRTPMKLDTSSIRDDVKHLANQFSQFMIQQSVVEVNSKINSFSSTFDENGRGTPPNSRQSSTAIQPQNTLKASNKSNANRNRNNLLSVGAILTVLVLIVIFLAARSSQNNYTLGNTNTSGGSQNNSLPTMLDFSSAPGFGTLSLNSGFLPDPSAVAVYGTNNQAVSNFLTGTGCVGYVTIHPDVKLSWSGSARYLRFYFVDASDTMLIVHTPSGSWYCDDDGYGGNNPQIAFNNPSPGTYSIWVGSYDISTSINGYLYVSKLSS